MYMALRTKKWTMAELHRLPDDGNTYELVHGELFVTPAPKPIHSLMVSRLLGVLAPYVHEHRLGELHVPRAVVRLLPDSEVEPDLMVRPFIPRLVAYERMPTPLLVVEVASDSTRRRDTGAKRELYAELGIPEYWFFDSEQRSCTIYRPNVEPIVERVMMTWSPAGATVPLTIDIAALYGGLEG